MAKKHELEKLQAMQDLSNLKNKMKEREKHISLGIPLSSAPTSSSPLLSPLSSSQPLSPLS